MSDSTGDSTELVVLTGSGSGAGCLLFCPAWPGQSSPNISSQYQADLYRANIYTREHSESVHTVLLDTAGQPFTNWTHQHLYLHRERTGYHTGQPAALCQ